MRPSGDIEAQRLTAGSRRTAGTKRRSYEEGGGMWSDVVAGGEVILQGDAGYQSEVSVVMSCRMEASRKMSLPREACVIVWVPCWQEQQKGWVPQAVLYECTMQPSYMYPLQDGSSDMSHNKGWFRVSI